MSAAPRVPGHALFFPAAALDAAVVLPASIAGFLGIVAPLPGLAFPAGHAHEMVFGFALAAVAGDQLGPTPRGRLAVLFASWLVARIAFLAAPHGLFAALANGAFAALLAWNLAPRLITRAKKMRNRALPVAIAALCACALAIQVGLQVGSGTLQRAALVIAILVLGLLMLWVGGRIIAPAAAGQAWRQGKELQARVQPRLEGALIVAMLAAVAAAATSFERAAGIAVIAAAGLAAVRMARWRLWALRGRPDLLCLGAGYGWLALGLACIGVALLSGSHLVTALHVVTVGAMGTLTINVMALTWARLARRDPARAALPVWSTLLIAAATLARVATDFGVADPRTLLLAAAGCWSAAYLLLLVLFVRMPRSAAVLA